MAMRTRNTTPERLFEVIEHNGRWRVRDMSSGEFVGVAFRFGDAADMAYELERQARQRPQHRNW
jgi:hypothetical protein